MTQVLSLQSTVFSNYFHKLMANHNIKSIRNGMKLLILYCYCEIISSSFSDVGIIFRQTIALVLFCVYFVFFVGTINVSNTTVMIRLSFIMVMLSITYTVILGTDNREVMETRYSLTISIILMMYTLFRFQFIITMLLSFVYILVFVSIGNYRLDFISTINITAIAESPLNARRNIESKIKNKRSLICGQCILFLMVYLVGLYLRFLNSIRRKSAFLKLAQYAESKIKMNSAIKVQTYWIEAIMPRIVKDEFMKPNRKMDMYNLVYCKMFDKVTILFADIVGFTEMSSNKTAGQLATLLNDLYNRFDEQGQIVNCEKLGTLGDCYYCVSGCPVPRNDHAICCIEMGLRICKIIQDFNKEYDQHVNMRVGVHSGRALAAIIGSQRFRFDVFSNDVFVANSLESSGRPGLVHVSEDTYMLAKEMYSFEEGERLLIKREEEHGIAGFVQKLIPIKTYFVVPNLKDNYENYKPTIKQGSLNKTKNTRLSMSSETSRLFSDTVQTNRNNENKNNSEKKEEHYEENINLIRGLQHDPDRPVDFFQKPPINPFLFTFNDKEIENHYLYHTTDQVEGIHIDSVKIGLLFDALATLIYTSALFLTACIMIPNDFGFRLRSPIVCGVGLGLVMIATFISVTYKSEIHNPIIRFFYTIFSHPIFRLFLSISISSIPSIFALSCYHSKLLHRDYQYSSSFFTLILFALLGNILSTTSSCIIKHISTMTFTALGIYLLLIEKSGHLEERNYVSVCTKRQMSSMFFQKERLNYHFIFQLIFTSLLIYYLGRENEKNIRINFYAHREAQIRNAEALRAKRIAESLLYNIIPKHVFSEIMKNKWHDEQEMTFNYALSVPKAGVVFASVSNFFSTYYREDYRSGENALKLLHTIICTFDNLLGKARYKHLEKIKTINDCYMVASGLNTKMQSSDSDIHLITLMYYAFEIIHQLRLFNKKNIIGTSGFELKVGYNFGPVSAGIIGTSKPLYDIWGDTVNVSSRMYSTTTANHIQVPESVVKTLEQYFEFKYRGKVSIKGKGEMTTYFATKPLDAAHLFVKQIYHEKPMSFE